MISKSVLVTVKNSPPCYVNLNEIGDEFGYLSKSHFFTDDITTFISNRLCRNPNVYTYKNVMNTKNKKLLLALRKFFTKVLESVKHLPDG